MKIAIVGSNPYTWEKVPTGNGWQQWRFSRCTWNKPPRFDKWFELHHPSNYSRYEAVFPGYTQFLRTDSRVITYDSFPWEAILDEFGSYFFSGGQAPWIMAAAIKHIITAARPGLDAMIGLWGINPVGDYKPQLSEVQHFVQVARDRGIEVIAPDDPEVLVSRPLYGGYVRPT